MNALKVENAKQIQMLVKENENLKRTNINLEKLADSKNNKEKFSQNLHEFYSEKLKQLRQKVNSQEELLAEKEIAITQKTIEVQEATEANLEKFQEIEALMAKNTSLEDKVTKLNTDLAYQHEEHEGAIEYKHYQYKKNSEKNKTLEKELQKEQQNFKTLESEKTQAKSTLEIYITENEMMKNEINQYKTQLQDFSDNIKKLNETQSLMHINLEEGINQNQQLLNENNEYKKQLAQVSSEYEDKSHDYTVLNRKERELKRNYDNLQVEIDKGKKFVNKNILKQFKANVFFEQQKQLNHKEKEDMLLDAQMKSQAEKEDLVAKVDELQQINKKLLERSEKADGDISGLKSERGDLSVDKDKLQKQLDEIQQTAAESGRSQEQLLQGEKDQSSQLFQENKELKTQLAQMQQELQALKNPNGQPAAAVQPQGQPNPSGYQLPSDQS